MWTGEPSLMVGNTLPRAPFPVTFKLQTNDEKSPKIVNVFYFGFRS